MGMMQQAIEQRCGQRRILSKGAVPLPERQVAGHNQAALFVFGGDHLEEQVGLLAVHRQVTDFVDDQQPIGANDPVHDRLQLILRMRRCQRHGLNWPSVDIIGLGTGALSMIGLCAVPTELADSLPLP